MPIVSIETIKAYAWGLVPSYAIGLGIASYFGLNATALGIVAETLIPLAGTLVPPLVNKVWRHYTEEETSTFTSTRPEATHKKVQRTFAIATASTAMTLAKLGMDDLANKTITTNDPQAAVAQYNDVFATEIFLMICIYLIVIYGHTPATENSTSSIKDRLLTAIKPISEPVQFLYDLFTLYGVCFKKDEEEKRESEFLIQPKDVKESTWSRCWNAMPDLGVGEKLSSCWAGMWSCCGKQNEESGEENSSPQETIRMPKSLEK